MGDSITEGTIAEWKKNAGDDVSQDEIVVLIETDKITVEVRSQYKGKFETAFAKEGDSVEVGADLFSIVESAGESTTPKADAGDGQVKADAGDGQVKADAGEIKQVLFNSVGDSITEGVVGEIVKKVGEWIKGDEVVLYIETDKIQAEVRAPEPGLLKSFIVNSGDTIPVGQPLFEIAAGVAPTSAETVPNEQKDAPSIAKKEPITGQVPKSDSKPPAPPPPPVPPSSPHKTAVFERADERVKMTSARKRTAIRLKDSQNTAAMLTTFNEVDMTNLMKFREQYKEQILNKHGVKLGFMSAFAKASAIALIENPMVNASIDGNDIITHNYVDISIAVSTPKSLVVPILRNVERMGFVEIEAKIAEFAAKAKENKLTVEEMTGGTFTISNGGVFGSLMGTPIINPPQSAILGMHGIMKRPVAIGDKIEVRPMMYIALTYDHRLIDGRDAVTALKRIKTLVEDPTSMLLDL